MKKWYFILFQFSLTSLFAQPKDFQLFGIRINVPDLKMAEDFYSGILHFQIERKDPAQKTTWLKTNNYKIYLVESEDAIYLNEKGQGQVSLALQVNNLDSSIAYLKSKNVEFIKEEKREEGIGWSIHILDPFGNALSLDQLNYTNLRVQEPSLYNCGLIVSDIDSALPNYEKLGLIITTRRYMPSDMPLYYTDKKFAFMLHRARPDMPSISNPNMKLVLFTPNESILIECSKRGIIERLNGQYVMTDATGVKTEIRLVTNKTY